MPSASDQGNVDHNVKAPIPPYNPPRLRTPDGRVVTVDAVYKYQEYPKLALKHATKDDVDEALSRAENFDERRNVMRYVRRPPMLEDPKTGRPAELIPLRDPQNGDNVVFHNAEEEQAFYEMYPEIEKVDTGSGAPPVTWEDPEYQEFLKWKLARKEGTRQGGMFASVAEERSDLLRRAEAVNLKIDKRWGHEALRVAVIKAETEAQPAQE